MGEPPYSDIHPMKVLFLIPKNPPPILEGNFSRAFKDFVQLCLQRLPFERPSARELLKHPFIKRAKKTTYLTELIERHERWQVTHDREGSDTESEYDEDDQRNGEAVYEDLWDFGTVRPIGGRGGLRPMNDAGANARALNGLGIINGEVNSKPRPDLAAKENHAFNGTMISALPLNDHRQSGSPQRQATRNLTPMSPGQAAKVPLPPSPMKPQDRSETRNTLLPSVPLPSNGGPNLQESLANDMGFLKLSPPDTKLRDPQMQMQRKDPPQPPAKQPNPIQKPLPQMNLAEIPPFRSSPKQSPLQSMTPQPTIPQKQDLPHSSRQQHAVQVPSSQPRFSPTQQSLPAIPPFNPSRSTSTSRDSSTSSTSSSASSTTLNNNPTPSHHHLQQHHPPVQPPQELTALNSVVVPALEAALQRRTYNLNTSSFPSSSSSSFQQSPATNTNGTTKQIPPIPMPTSGDLARRQHAHEKIKKLVMKAAGVFAEIERWDRESPAGMGGGVEAFLEGFLEEVLVRVEAEDEDPGVVGR